MSAAAPERIFVAGHRGLVGSALARKLEADGARLIVRSRDALDLESREAVAELLQHERPDSVFLAAGRVGGVLANSHHPAEFLYSNLAIQANVIHESWRADVGLLLFLGSSCIYPRDAPIPLREESLLTGPLEATNEAYAIAKIAGIAMCTAYSRQYGCDFRSVMPTNLFGPGDNYDLASGHFLAAILRKCHLAKLCEAGDAVAVNRDEARYGPIPDATCAALGLERVEGRLALAPGQSVRIKVWGSGKPLREYLWVDDLAEACALVASLPREEFLRASTATDGRTLEFLNIGSGEEKSVAEIASLAREIVGARSPLVFDPSKPDGTPRKLLDSSRVRALGWAPRRGLAEGIEAAYRDYLA